MKRTVLSAVILAVLLAVNSMAVPSAIVTSENTSEKPTDNIEVNVGSLYGSWNHEGLGTQEFPYVISDAAHFNEFAELVNAAQGNYASAYWKLAGNIDFHGTQLMPVGTKNSQFTGVFDGNGYSIVNFTLPDINYAGVIGCMSGGTVKNLGVKYVNAAISVEGGTFVGGIVGYINGSSDKDTYLTGCYTDGSLSVTGTTGAVAVGGIVGKIMIEKGNVYITDCGADCDINVNSKTTCYVGGVVGNLSSKSSCKFKLTGCFANGDVYGNTQLYYSYCGGFAGYINQDESGWTDWYGTLCASDPHIENCFADGNVTSSGGTANNAGGLVGYVSSYVVISNCYRTSSQVVLPKDNDLSGTITDKANLADKTFLSQNVGFDMDNTWYLTSGRVASRLTCGSVGAPTTKNAASIKITGEMGIRFSATALTQMRDFAGEYGFILSLEDYLNELDEELTFDFSGRYVYGKAYDVADGTDIIYELNEDDVLFTGVLINVPDTQYNAKIVARSYLKYTSGGKTNIMYGNTVTKSMYDIAVAAKNSDSYEAMDDNAKMTINNIITAAEKNAVK